MTPDENQPMDVPQESEAPAQHAIVPEGALTRRGSAALGAKYYAIALISAPVGCYIWNDLIMQTQPLQFKYLIEILFIMVPPLAALGASAGHSLYKRANSDELSKPVGCWGWCLVFLCFQFWIIPLYLSHRHRKNALDRDRTAIWLPALYLVSSLLFGVGVFHFDKHFSAAAAMIYSALLAAAACDALLVNRIVNLRKAGMLAPPDTKKFQFSLGTLLIFVWGLGAWITGLVMLVRR